MINIPENIFNNPHYLRAFLILVENENTSQRKLVVMFNHGLKKDFWTRRKVETFIKNVPTNVFINVPEKTVITPIYTFNYENPQEENVPITAPTNVPEKDTEIVGELISILTTFFGVTEMRMPQQYFSIIEFANKVYDKKFAYRQVRSFTLLSQNIKFRERYKYKLSNLLGTKEMIHPYSDSPLFENNFYKQYCELAKIKYDGN